MVDISIVDGGFKLTYNWGVPHCIKMVMTGGWCIIVLPTLTMKNGYWPSVKQFVLFADIVLKK